MRISSSLVALAFLSVVSAGIVPGIGHGSSVSGTYPQPSGSPTGTWYHHSGQGRPSGSPTGTSHHHGGKGGHGGSGSHAHPSGTHTGHIYPSGFPTGGSHHSSGQGGRGTSAGHVRPSGSPGEASHHHGSKGGYSSSGDHTHISGFPSGSHTWTSHPTVSPSGYAQVRRANPEYARRAAM